MVNGKWKARLKEDGLEYYKSSHCETLNGQFHKFRALGWDEGKRRALVVRDDLYHIVKTSPVMALGVTLSVPFHQTMLCDPQTFGEVPKVPYRLAFQQVLAECAKAMLLLGHGSVVTFGHDDGDDFAALHKLFKEFKNRNPRYARIMADFVPLDDKRHPPVQAADVAAWITFQFANEFVSNPTPDTAKKLGDRMYKLVNWLDAPYASMAIRPNSDELPAEAVYAP